MPKSNVKKFTKEKGYESINRNMLQDEDNLSLEAIGLLANLTSYSETWELHKTELYKRFAKSGRRKVEKAWNELVDEKYIVQLRRRVGKTYEYIYYHSQTKFTEEEVKQIVEIEGCGIWNGKMSNKEKTIAKGDDNSDSSTVQNAQSNSTVQNAQSKLGSSKSTDKKLTIDEVYHQEKDIKEDTYKDTDHADNISHQNNDINIKLEQEKIYKETLRGKMPNKIFNTLSILSNDYDEMFNWYGILLRAKKSIEVKKSTWLPLENEDTENIININLQNAIRSIKKHKKDNPDNFLFACLKNEFEIIANMKNANEQIEDYEEA